MKKRFFEDLSDVEHNNLAAIITQVENDPEKTNKLLSYLRDKGLLPLPYQVTKAIGFKTLGFKELTKAERKRNLERLAFIRKV
jgi:hypothetical protein